MTSPLSAPTLSSPSPESADSTLPHILVVEDSLTSVAVISRDLREYYTLLHARDGEAAWEMLLSDPRIELVITDVQMPVLDGPQAWAAIRRLDPHVRCCFMAGYACGYSADRLLGLGAARVFAKPFHDLAAFAETVRSLVSPEPVVTTP